MTEDQMFICILFFMALYGAAIYGMLKRNPQEDILDPARRF